MERRVEERTRELSNLNDELARQIDERLRAEEELRLAQGELIQAAKLAVLGQMSTAIVHEVSQPLAAIETYLASSRVLLDRGMGTALGENFDVIGDLIARMRRMTKTLKAFARKETGVVEEVSAEAVVQIAADLVRPRLRTEGITLVVENEAPGMTLRVNNIRLQQVLMNLLSNAADAIGEARERRITVRIGAAGGFARISVADTGAGIPAQLKERVIEPFFTTKQAGEGLGLGLAISNAIIADAGGHLVCEDAPAGGAVFTVRLPLAIDSPSEAAE